MEIKEFFDDLREMLGNLPDKDYLDKLIEASKLWSQIKDDLPNEDYLNKLMKVPNSDFFEELPDEDFINKLNNIPDENFFEDLPREEHLDKLIEAGKLSDRIAALLQGLGTSK
jgi:hypothetical protein